ncbi:MAG: DUF5011 domain-containing protein [Firmicutes bacterium]|nr:DUF5011 domain-containing protein [Bacillota bacterium]
MKKFLIVIITVLGILIPLTLSIYFAFIPNLELKGSKNQKVVLNNEYKELGASAENLFGKDNYKIEVQGKVDTNKVGTYKIKYTYKDGLIKKSVVRNVKVIDEESPIITLEGGEEVFVCPNTEYEELGYNATDNYDGDITDKVKITKTDSLIKYTVKDTSSNTTTIERNLKYEDKESPIITLSGNESISLPLGQAYKEPGYSAIDNCDGDLNKEVKVTNNIDVNKVGNYEIKYTVIDKSGNETSITRTVKVYNNKVQIKQGIYKSSMIYLTFDDGPSASITPKVLDILKETGVKATFFVTCKSDSLNYLIKRAHDEGHTIALHTCSHNYSQIYKSETAFFDDLYTISNKVKSITGVESKITRFPGGSSNTVSRQYNSGIMSRLVSQMNEKGFTYFDWNVGSGDAGGASNKNDVYNNVIKGISPTKTNVVLMHDFENNYKTLNALKDIITTCKNAGYTFAAIDSNTPQIAHGVNN